MPVMEELQRIMLWIQYQDEFVQDIEEMPWSPVFMLSIEKARALIVELQKQVEKLEGLEK